MDTDTPEMWWRYASPIGPHSWGNTKMVESDCTDGTLKLGVRETTVKPPWNHREPPLFGVNPLFLAWTT